MCVSPARLLTCCDNHGRLSDWGDALRSADAENRLLGVFISSGSALELGIPSRLVLPAP